MPDRSRVRNAPGRAPAGPAPRRAADLALGLVAIQTVRAYFFLFDDYFFVSAAQSESLSQLVSRQHAGFYRPLTLLLFSLEGALFGWQSPAGYAAVSLLLHLGCAVLVAILLFRHLAVSREVAALSLGIFLIVPWRGEVFSWISSQADLLSLLLGLASVGFGLELLHSRPVRTLFLLWLATAVTFLLSLLAKEGTIVLPLLLVVLAAADLKRWDRTWWWRVAAGCGAFALAASAFFLLKGRVLLVTDSPYGSLSSLLDAAAIPANLASFARIVLQPPIEWPGGRADLLYLVSLASLVALAFLRRPMLAGVLVCGWLASHAPIVWYSFPARNTSGGRLVYVASVWLVALLAIGSSAIQDGRLRGRFRPRPRLIAVAVSAIVLAFSVCALRSLVYQRNMWLLSYSLAEGAIRRFEPMVGSKTPVHVVDMPHWFVQGPYVLKSNAFTHYYRERKPPAVRAEAVIFSYSGGRAAELYRTAEHANAKAPPGGEVEVSVSLRPEPS
jgi:hypothetical protein